MIEVELPDGTTLGSRPDVFVPITMRGAVEPGFTGFDHYGPHLPEVRNGGAGARSGGSRPAFRAEAQPGKPP